MSKIRPGGRKRTAEATAAGTEPRATQQERAQRTRALIIDRAAEAFGGLGYEGASLNEIIRATGLTKGAFYHHFGSKDELALAVFRAKQGELVSRIREAAQDQPNALLALQAMLRRRAQLLVSEPSLGCFLRLASELGVRFGQGSEFAQSYAVPVAVMTELVARGQSEGVFRSELDPRAAGETIMATLLGTDELSKVTAGGADLPQRTETWLAVLLVGLIAQPASPP